jgi:hypothetical protein
VILSRDRLVSLDTNVHIGRAAYFIKVTVQAVIAPFVCPFDADKPANHRFNARTFLKNAHRHTCHAAAVGAPAATDWSANAPL